LKRFNAFDSIHPNRYLRWRWTIRGDLEMICVLRAVPRPVSGVLKVALSLGLGATLFGQFRGGSDWSANGGDAQRSYWVRTDAKISPATIAAPGLGNEPLSMPVLIERYIGYRGFRAYAFVGGHAEDAFGLDSDLGRVEWEKHLAASVGSGGGNCPGGMTAALTRQVTAALAPLAAGRFAGGGRGGPAKSGVGEPMEGAVTLAQVVSMRPPTPPPTPTPAPDATASQPVRRAAAPNIFEPKPTLLYSLSGDGALHTMNVSNGEEASPAIPFLPGNADVSDFAVVDGIAYAATAGHCGGAADGVWAVDLETKAVTKWEGSLAGGAPAFAPLAPFVATGSTLVALDEKTLAAGTPYSADQPFSTAPAVFEYKTKAMVAAATKDGMVHVIDAASPTVAAAKSAAGEADPYALATWQTTAETRWIVATGAKSITAWKIADKNGTLTLQQGWAVHDIASPPAAPLIINGVLFLLQRGDRGHHAVLSAFDASTGKQLWTSGTTVSSYVGKDGGLAAGGSAVYFGTHDGTLWSFGFPIEH
jgi:outer membrane protein assembly factor BamB